MTIVIHQGDQGSDAGEDEEAEFENVTSVEGAAGIQILTTTGPPEWALTKFLVHENVIREASPI